MQLRGQMHGYMLPKVLWHHVGSWLKYQWRNTALRNGVFERWRDCLLAGGQTSRWWMYSRSTRMPMKLTRKHFFGVIILFEVAFNLIPYKPNAPTYDLFLWSDVHVTAVSYVYFLFEHLAKIYLCVLLLSDANKQTRFITGAFTFLVVADFIDFLGGFNTPYRVIGSFPISYNILQAILFIVFCFIEPKDDGWKSTRGSFRGSNDRAFNRNPINAHIIYLPS